ncbi:hypothetical protein [Brenneria sp. L4-2C]
MNLKGRWLEEMGFDTGYRSSSPLSGAGLLLRRRLISDRVLNSR